MLMSLAEGFIGGVDLLMWSQSIAGHREEISGEM